MAIGAASAGVREELGTQVRMKDYLHHEDTTLKSLAAAAEMLGRAPAELEAALAAYDHARRECCVGRDPEGKRPWCRRCAGEYMSLSPKRIANLEAVHQGPRNVGTKGRPRYRKADLDAWLAGEAAA